ncbi:MAG: hypothetical protein J0G35_05000, partial [Acidobacteriales bacterium]|nr:hypothetical protein [Terriglobales bacterium]
RRPVPSVATGALDQRWHIRDFVLIESLPQAPAIELLFTRSRTSQVTASFVSILGLLRSLP